VSEQILCTCGTVLVEEVTPTGVRPLGAEQPIVFRRTTDYVVCSNCYESYNVVSLIERATSQETIDQLEAMAESAED